MDKFDLQIAMLKPPRGPAKLDEKQFMKKLAQTHRVRLMRRALMGLMGIAILAAIAGALRRDILGVLTLTFRYFGDLPSMLTEYSHAYTATISWPSIVSLLFAAVLGIMLIRSRKDLAAIRSKRTYRYATALAVLALGMGITGLVGSSARAHAEQDALKRTLNARGHLEIQVGDTDYELYGKSNASDDSIRGQAIIENIRNFDISKAYLQYEDMDRNGLVAEVRAINSKDGCIDYVERRLEPALNKVMDVGSGCIHSSDPIQYLTQELKPTSAPKWKVGQALYLALAHVKGTPQNVTPENVNSSYIKIAVLLDGKANQYIASSNSEKIVPKGQPGTGVESCGIHRQDLCPQTGAIDVFTNAEGEMASGESGSSVPGNSLKPKSGSAITEFFAKIIADDDHNLRLITDSGKKLTVNWSDNVIADFNTHGAQNYQMASETLQVLPGDHLILRIAYRDDMDLQSLSLSDVYYMGVALKSSLPDPLSGQTYSKEKAMQQTEKY